MYAKDNTKNLFKLANSVAENFFSNNLADYQGLRNYDFGPNKRDNVSCLSPFITHRLILEQELIKRSLDFFSFAKIEKFIQEIYWRTYWKGWLELRPAVWEDFISEGVEIYDESAYEKATNGNTGIDCFDFWINELKEENFLHNHTRMWFASIWIFTLGLPWQLGAEFFMKYLLDGDAASNTLSWRWVAGIQTKGKHYIARPSNISKFSDGRFHPKGLNTVAEPLNEEKEYLKEPLNLAFNETKKNNTLVMFENDLWLEGRENLYKSYENIYLILLTNADRKIELDEKVLAFKKKALSDVEIYLDNSSLESPEKLQQHNSFDVVYPSVGENLDFLREVQKTNNTDINFITREEDIFCWEFSNKGFFNFKKNIPDILKKFSY
jgi:deoxyribodipyrimidine photo-lyase